MKEKIKTIINRKDWSFCDFLKKYWWIELLAIGKVIFFVSEGYYGYTVALLIVIGVFMILWFLYRIGLK